MARILGLAGLLASSVWGQTITTVAGTGGTGYSGDGGPATSAQVWRPLGLAADAAGNLYICSWYGNWVRKVDTNGTITTVAGTGVAGYSGDGGPATLAKVNHPWGLAVDRLGNLYIGDRDNDRVRKVDPAGVITTVAGTGVAGYSGDGGPATQAMLYRPNALAMDTAGRLLIADGYNCRVRRVDAAGVITTIAGSGACGYSGDGGPATSARMSYLSSLVVDQADNLYIGDQYQNQRVRKVDGAGVITTAAGNGTQGQSGDGGLATSAQVSNPSGLAVDRAGNLYIACQDRHRVRRIDAAGVITTVVGTGTEGFSGDGGPATSAMLRYPTGLAMVGAGDLFIADQDNQRVRKVVVYTNHPPVPGAPQVSVLEDVSVAIALTGTDPEGDPLTFVLASQPAHGSVVLTGSTATYTPAANHNGGDGFAYSVSDGQGGTAAATVSVTVTAVNDAPLFTKGPDLTVLADAGPQTVAGWAMELSAGPADEAAQVLDFVVTSDNAALFSVQPAVDAAGNLTCTPAAHADGPATVTIRIRDDGGTANGGVDTSDPQECVITVQNPNRPPVANAGADQTVEAAGPTTTAVTLDGTGSSDPNGDALSYTWVESNTVIAGPSTSPIVQVAFELGTHTLTLAVNDGQVDSATPSGNPVGSDETVVVKIVDTTPPVVSAPADVTAEATGPQTAVAIGTATATDAVGVVSMASDAPATFPLGTTAVTWTAKDAAGNAGTATQQVIVKDTTAPVVTAALTAISRGRDEDEDGHFYRVTATGTDLVDAHPVVSALITQPLTPITTMAVSYKREKKNRIQIKTEKRKLQVQLAGPSRSELEDLWNGALLNGGFAVSDGQEVQLIVQKEKRDEYEAQYQFDRNLKLTSAKSPGLKLAVWARDAAGNQSPRVEVVPGKRARSDRDGRGDNDRRDAKLAGESTLPAGFDLAANYPNPFNPFTTLRYNLAAAGQVRLTIYNVMGQQVRVLVDRVQEAGAYQIEWNSRDEAGHGVAPGLYLYRRISGNQSAVGKMLLAK
jgi:hypothetical protein